MGAREVAAARCLTRQAAAMCVRNAGQDGRANHPQTLVLGGSGEHTPSAPHTAFVRSAARMSRRCPAGQARPALEAPLCERKRALYSPSRGSSRDAL